MLTWFILHFIDIIRENMHFFFVNIIIIALVFVENTRTVSRNIGCKNLVDENKSSNSINVLIPKVIQVYSNLTIKQEYLYAIMHVVQHRVDCYLSVKNL